MAPSRFHISATQGFPVSPPPAANSLDNIQMGVVKGVSAVDAAIARLEKLIRDKKRKSPSKGPTRDDTREALS